MAGTYRKLTISCSFTGIILSLIIFTLEIEGVYTNNDTNFGPSDGEGSQISIDLQSTCSPAVHSCQGRCETEPRSGCSCHHTCQVYDNCCEDYVDFCASTSLGKQKVPVDVRISCIDNNLLIASCPPNFEDEYNTRLVEDGKSNGLLEHMLMMDSSLTPGDVLAYCEYPRDTNITLQAPVTDPESRLQYANVFCAACNNASSVEFWSGFIRCNGSVEETSSWTNSMAAEDGLTGKDDDPKPEDELIPGNVSQEVKLRVLASPNCRMLWFPLNGSPNRCVQEWDLNHDVSRDQSLLLPEVFPAAHMPDGHFPIINDTLQADDSSHHNGSHLASLNLEWQDVGPGRVDVFDHPNKTMIDRKCGELTSYVEYPERSGNVYKNKYCYMAHHNYTRDGLNFCEPDFKTQDTGSLWFTLVRHEVDSPSNHTGLWRGLGQVVWNLYSGIQTAQRRLFERERESQECARSSAIRRNGQCHQRSFSLRYRVNYTFSHSSIVRGDYNEQVESYSKLLIDTTLETWVDSFLCINVYTRHFRSKTNSYFFSSDTQFECAEITDLSVNGSSFDQASLLSAGTLQDTLANRYIAFVTAILKTVMGTEKAITLPVTVEMYPCIFVVVNDMTNMKGYCSEVRSVWKAVRRVDAIIGGISLEGIITIICCILSDIGLLVRLALQNVVPFYKSYPGKIQFNLCLSLLLAYTLFLIGGVVEEGSTLCHVIAVMTHLAFLSALFWMNVTAFEIWRTFRHWRNQVVSRGYVSLILTMFYAVGIPLLYVVTALVLERVAPTSELSPSYGEHYCWLNGSMAVAVYFVIPCSFICCMNIVFVGLTLRSLRRQRTSISEFKKSNTKTAVTDTAIVIKIILLVGITWLLGLLAALVDKQVLWIIFTIINASLGFMISCVLVTNKRVYYAVQNKCLCYTVESTAVVSTQVPRH